MTYVSIRQNASVGLVTRKEMLLEKKSVLTPLLHLLGFFSLIKNQEIVILCDFSRVKILYS